MSRMKMRSNIKIFTLNTTDKIPLIAAEIRCLVGMVSASALTRYRNQFDIL